MDIPLNVTCDVIRPDYSILDFYNGMYKIIRYKSTAVRIGCVNKEGHASYDEKLDASLSRSRRAVLEYALCNEWKYFCTFTIAKDNYDRKDLATWHKSFSQWLRDQRKKAIANGVDCSFSFLLVPEQHKDGSWHMHGLFSDISSVLVSFDDLAKNGAPIPTKLLGNNFYNWVDYQEKFGFCSFGLIKDKIAASYYISKYITKSLQGSCIEVGLHTYYVSRDLKRPVKHGSVYGACSSLDKYLNKHFDFCSTGMVTVSDPAYWAFGFEFMDSDLLELFSDPPEENENVDIYVSYTQDIIDGFR